MARVAEACASPVLEEPAPKRGTANDDESSEPVVGRLGICEYSRRWLKMQWAAGIRFAYELEGQVFESPPWRTIKSIA